jgi:ADP-ribose pyrophosphatase
VRSNDEDPDRGAGRGMTAAGGPHHLAPADAERDPLAEETLSSKIVFEGVFLRVLQDRVRTPDGHETSREFLRHPGAVMMIPLLDDGQVVLERQYRYPLGRSFIEFPAGKIDAGEGLLECAQRELKEETGYVAAEWIYLGGFHNAIGYSDERIEVFLARGLTMEEARTDDGEVLEVFTATREQLLAWIGDGTVTDVKTIIGAYWLERFVATGA